MAIKRIKRLLRRRKQRRQTLVTLALVALRNRNDAERLRRAHASVLALYNERGRELDALRRRVRELEERRAAARAA